jgi:hypothetical protein
MQPRAGKWHIALFHLGIGVAVFDVICWISAATLDEGVRDQYSIDWMVMVVSLSKRY